MSMDQNTFLTDFLRVLLKRSRVLVALRHNQIRQFKSHWVISTCFKSMNEISSSIMCNNKIWLNLKSLCCESVFILQNNKHEYTWTNLLFYYYISFVRVSMLAGNMCTQSTSWFGEVMPDQGRSRQYTCSEEARFLSFLLHFSHLLSLSNYPGSFKRFPSLSRPCIILSSPSLSALRQLLTVAGWSEVTRSAPGQF